MSFRRGWITAALCIYGKYRNGLNDARFVDDRISRRGWAKWPSKKRGMFLERRDKNCSAK
jgi:hypothetical protein